MRNIYSAVRFSLYPLLSGLLLLTGLNPVMAEIYKWTDAEGQVHYSDRGVKHAEQLNTSKNPLRINITPGLSRFEQEQLRAIEKSAREAQRKRDKQQQIEERQRLKKVNTAKQEARRCRHFTHLKDRYRAKLRAGCTVTQCREYKRRVKEYQLEIDDYCR